MHIRSLLAVPVLVLAAACGGGSNEPPAVPATPPAASASAAPADTTAAPAASAAPADTSAAPAASAAPADTSAAADAGASPAPVAANVPAPPKPWDQLDQKGRLDVMKNAVLPNMKTAFQNFDAKDFANFNCQTCHGKKAKETHFKMPNPDLPKLDFKNMLKDDIAKHPETVKFMHEVVVPQMVTMLGVQPFDMKTMKGFGCSGCHVGK